MTKYSVGDQFLIPTDYGPVHRGWVRGVVARADGRGIVLGYFFDPILTDIPKQPTGLDSADAFLVIRFLETGLTRGTWPILGPTPQFQSREWPVPPFRDVDSERPDHAWQVRFDDAMENEVSRRSVTIGTAVRLGDLGAISATSVAQFLAHRFAK